MMLNLFLLLGYLHSPHYIFDNCYMQDPPLTVHELSSVAEQGQTIALEDGSVWQISDYDRYKVKHWREQDTLILTQNQKWFSKYSYRIINQHSGGSIDVNFLQFSDQIHRSNRLLSADLFANRLTTMQEGVLMTYWEVAPEDQPHLAHWKEKDIIIIGHNSNPNTKYDSLLINPSFKTPICARRQ